MRKLSRNDKSRILINVLLLIIALFYLLPLYYVLINSVKKSKFISTQPFAITLNALTFENIANAFKYMKYPIAFLNSLIILIISCIVFIIAGSLAAFGITVINNKTMNSVYTFFVSLISIPFQIAMIPLVVMLTRIGLTDNYLGIAFIYSAMFLPFVIFLYTGFMRTIPKEMQESATIDGCNLFQIYWRIYVPLLKTITGIVLVLRGVFIWNDLLVPLIAITNPTMHTLQLKLYVFTYSRVGQWALIFGGSVIVSLPITILFILLQRTFIKGVMTGSIKG